MTHAQEILINQINEYKRLADSAKKYSGSEASRFLQMSDKIVFKLAEISSNVEYKTITKEVIKEVPLKIEYVDKEVIKEVPVEVIKEVEVIKYVERSLSEKAQEILGIEMMITGDFNIFADDSDMKENKIEIPSSINSSLEKLKNLNSKQHYVQLGYIVNSIMLLSSFIMLMF
jgi:hypothetical protein